MLLIFQIILYFQKRVNIFITLLNELKLKNARNTSHTDILKCTGLYNGKSQKLTFWHWQAMFAIQICKNFFKMNSVYASLPKDVQHHELVKLKTSTWIPILYILLLFISNYTRLLVSVVGSFSELCIFQVTN